tara:strand:- start:118 stop:570 length:453 start_codon:yes stop_codon:yes gene_type:complete
LIFNLFIFFKKLTLFDIKLWKDQKKKNIQLWSSKTIILQEFWWLNYLKLWGIKDIVEAGDGKDALLKPYWNDVDLVISDWRMPEMNGLEFYRQAKEDGLLENVPVLMVYAEKEKVKVIEAAKEVISYYVIKSIDLMVMQGKIRKLPKRPD